MGWLRLPSTLTSRPKSELPTYPRLPSILSLSFSSHLPACPRLPSLLSLSLSLLCSHPLIPSLSLSPSRSSSPIPSVPSSARPVLLRPVLLRYFLSHTVGGILDRAIEVEDKKHGDLLRLDHVEGYLEM
ncbi:uncharacterized protein LOC114265221 [Camellia sinensis]|uniref:uncharacterized protein LOC114265221 n=1 Tax=Camellia sinensis TaxID=4442 RepID=UPI0010362CC4|nr:uncharacterized protein LOC114265221 [Camellia sinensis]